MTARDRLLLPLLGACAGLSCATPTPRYAPSDALLIEAYRLYGKGDCAALRNQLERTDFSGAAVEMQTSFDLLAAFCAERDGEILSAKDRYNALIAKAPRGAPALEASLRLREMERLEQQGTTREELAKRAEETRISTTIYLHGAKPLNAHMPLYPRAASAAGVEGEVRLDLEIARNGTITELVVLHSDPPFLFDAVALNAVRNWVYPPAADAQQRRAAIRFPFRIAPPSETATPVAPRVDRSTLDPLELRGWEMYEQSVAASRARAAIRQAGHLWPLLDWIVVADDGAMIVRYLDETGRAFADVRVDIYSSELEQVGVHGDPVPLPPEQHAMWKARTAALSRLASHPFTPCTDAFTTMVLPSLDPDRAWDVYVSPISADGRTIPIGGHYRISVSSKPDIAPELSTFADSCPPRGDASDPERLMIKQVTASAPSEIYVYLNLRYGRPLGVALPGDGGLWSVERGQIWRPDDARADTSSE